MVSVEYSEAIVEVLDILNNSEEGIIEKIPTKLLQFWERNKSKTYTPNLDHSMEIDEMNLKDKTKSIISMIYLNYLCDDSEKEDIKIILKNNEEKYQQELREKYNTDNIFKNRSQEIKEGNVSLVEYKESLFTRIINRIKRFFHIA